MEDSDFSDEFCRFIQLSIPSVESAELLLALRTAAGPVKPDTPEAARQMEAFRARGLVQFGADGAASYQPATPELAKHADTLDAAWRQRPVTLIRVIYALRDQKIRSFADAFRIRKG
jgi:hypothetical protein